jgi:putative ABC transport system permease protein
MLRNYLTIALRNLTRNIPAFVLSAPIAWYAMKKWLETFKYHTSVEPVIFVIAGLTALAIALVTISFESLRAASANPVQSLRNE